MTSDQILDKMRAVFRLEALDLLTELDSALLSLEASPDDTSLIHRAFRAIHTLKGSGATAGLVRMSGFAHKVEEVFDRAREGKLAISPELVDAALSACDVLKRLLEDDAETDQERNALAVLAAASGTAGVKATESVPVPKGESQTVAWEITFKPGADLYRSGTDPGSLLEELAELGPVLSICHTDGVPPIHELDAEACRLWWTVQLVSEASEDAIRDVFLFVQEDCEELVIRRSSHQEAGVALLRNLPAYALETYLTECLDHLQSIEGDAIECPEFLTMEAVQRVFRSVHTIKGNSAVLLGDVAPQIAAHHPLAILHQAAHGLETHLSTARDTGNSFGTDKLLACIDLFRSLLAELEGGRAVSPDDSLFSWLGIPARGEVEQNGTKRRPDERTTAFFEAADQCIEMAKAALPRLDEASVQDAFRRGLKTLAAASQHHGYEQLQAAISAQLAALDAALQTGGCGSPNQWTELRKLVDTTAAEVERIRTGKTEAAGTAAARTDLPQKAANSSIRVDQSRLDRLMRIAGELLVARGAFPPLVAILAENPVSADVGRQLNEAEKNISRIADELQSTVMAVRMVPIKNVLQRFPRMVRDLARSLGKEVQLVLEGEDTELDKTVAEQIGDPLVHLVRNSLDHGLETPEGRREAGKPVTGTVRVRTSQRSGSVRIEVIDDGRGLDPGALRRKAVERGVLTQAAAEGMPDREAFDLIFQPGLSTAKALTDVSGRGVGMDVVRANVLALRGTISLDSEPGRGTTVAIHLPASLMVSRGILVRLGREEYILPVENILDMVKLPASRIREYKGRKFAEVRGEVFPLVPLADRLGIQVNEPRDAEYPVAIVAGGGQRFGLVISKFVSEVEVIVKPLTGATALVKEFGGACVMGDGRLVLVINPDEVAASIQEAPAAMAMLSGS